MGLTEIVGGNALEDGKPFRQWFIGNLEQWAERNGLELDLDALGLRNNRKVEVKWGFHSQGETRAGGWTASPGQIAISILVQGNFTILFRTPGTELSQMLEKWLRQPGDYVIWREDVEHTWMAQEDSIVLTVRWSDR